MQKRRIQLQTGRIQLQKRRIQLQAGRIQLQTGRIQLQSRRIQLQKPVYSGKKKKLRDLELAIYTPVYEVIWSMMFLWLPKCWIQ